MKVILCFDIINTVYVRANLFSSFHFPNDSQPQECETITDPDLQNMFSAFIKKTVLCY